MTRARLAVLAPLLLFAALVAATWQRWYTPFQDHGREVGTAYRIAHGDLLYRDVPYLFGPLPPLADAAALRLLGERLGTLLALRLLLAAAGVLLLARLARRLVRDEAAACAAACLAVAACALVPAGAWAFPYSVAALWGAVGTWGALEAGLASEGIATSLLAGALGGLAAGAKVDAAPGALAAVAIPLLLRRPRREALAGVALAGALAAAAYGLPPLLLGADAIANGPIGAVRHVPAIFRSAQADVFVGGDPADFFAGGWWRIVFPSLPVLAAVLLLAHLPGAERPVRRGLVLVAGLAAAFGVPGGDALHALLPLAALLALGEWGVRLFRRTEPPAPEGIASLATGLAMLPALARQPLLQGTSPYAAFATPLALVFVGAGLARRLRSAPAFALFLGALAAGEAASRLHDYRDVPRSLVALPRGTLLLEKGEAALVRRLVADLDRLSPPGARVAVLPEGGLVGFLAARLPAFGPEQLHPGHVPPAQEERLLARAAADPPSVVVLVNRDLWEFGHGAFGPAEIPRLWALLAPRLELVDAFGAEWTARPPGGARAAAARVYVLRSLAARTPNIAASGATAETTNGSANR